MNTRFSMILAIVAVLVAFPAAAYYIPYGSNSYDYSHSYDTQSVVSHESEFEHSDNAYGGFYHNTNQYDYGRSRTFEFSRTAESETEHRSSSYDTGARYGYPYYNGYDGRDYSTYSYPYYDVNSGDYRDYRPYHDYYGMSFTSPNYDSSPRVSSYLKHYYTPYGY